MFQLTPNMRVRHSPFYEATLAEGVKSFSTYNHMLLPTGYGHPEAEYHRLIKGVSMWDVGVERQVQLQGPDAERLAQVLVPRDLAKCKVGQGKYVALCNSDGILINDPVLSKLDEDRFWLSIADSNILIYAQAIAAERGFRVEVTEPDASPLAVQGPMAESVVAALCGDWVRDLKYFWIRETEVEGIPLVVARSGWSKQGGFELYLMDGRKGTQLWDLVREAGRPWGIGPGNPNHCERIESGLLSWGGDTDMTTNPFEVRMERYLDLDVPDDVIGIQALRRIKAEGPKRHQLGIVLEDEEAIPALQRWRPIRQDGRKVGDMTCGVWSWRLERNIGFALISRDCHPGDEVEVEMEIGTKRARLTELPFI